MNNTDSLLANIQAAGLLEAICQSLELSKTQFETAESRYKGVSEWLSKADHQLLSQADIFPQGSMALGTTVRPLDREEFDVDLVCHIPANKTMTPQSLKKLVGDRIAANGNYSPLLSDEKPRCWRLDYANEFHMDITPSIPNSECLNNGELVPDKTLGEWKASNPRGYKSWFDEHGAAVPSVRCFETDAAEQRADIDSLPQPTRLRGPLRRIVQLCKRHRDVWAKRQSVDDPPISIILTTLAAKSYNHCATTGSFNTELDLVEEVLRYMPSFIQVHHAIDGEVTYSVPNETTPGENFAERWNQNPQLASNFLDWHHSAMEEIVGIRSVHGLDNVEKSLRFAFGDRTAQSALDNLTGSISNSRASGLLGATAGVGLTAGHSAQVSARTNTFYGR